MLFLGLLEDYHVVQVDQSVGQVQLTKPILHEPLECHWSITKPIRHPQELIHSHATHHKGSVLLGVLGDLDLAKVRFQVHGGEEKGTYHRLHGLLHPRKGVCIFLALAIQSVEVNAEPEAPIFLMHQDHRVAPWALRRVD